MVYLWKYYLFYYFLSQEAYKAICSIPSFSFSIPFTICTVKQLQGYIKPSGVVYIGYFKHKLVNIRREEGL